MFALFNAIFAIAAIILDNLLGIAIDGLGYGPIYGIYLLAMLVPGLAAAVRRLHDTGKSGYMLLVSLIPIAGAIWLIVLLVREGDTGPNEYGPDPKSVVTLTEAS